MSNIIEETDIFNELLNWAHGEVPDTIFIEEYKETTIKQQDIEDVIKQQDIEDVIKQQDIEEVIKQQDIEEVIKQQDIEEVIKQQDIEEVIKQQDIEKTINQDVIFIKNAISEIKTQLDLIEICSNQIDIVIQNITQITVLIDKMNIELANTEQLENKYTILQKIRMFEISYVVITRAFLTSVEATETTIINMVKKTITIAVMIAAIDKTNKNAEIVVSKLTELMETWEKKTNEAEIAKNAVMIFITSIQIPMSLLNQQPLYYCLIHMVFHYYWKSMILMEMQNYHVKYPKIGIFLNQHLD
jgi:hypothetical protein